MTIDDTWDRFLAKYGAPFTTECWENSKHERVCKMTTLVNLDVTFVLKKFLDGERNEIMELRKIKIPEFCLSHWLLRIPLAIVFIQQGLMKIPVDIAEVASYGLSYLVWWFVAYGELLGGIGLIIGGIMNKPYLPILDRCYIPDIGDAITRFSGITLCCIMTGVIWIGEPESFMDVILYDNLHVFLWVGGLIFALRGNRLT